MYTGVFHGVTNHSNGNVYIIDMGEFAAINEVYGRFFTGDSPPARACVEVSGLPKGALFEIDCVALA